MLLFQHFLLSSLVISEKGKGKGNNSVCGLTAKPAQFDKAHRFTLIAALRLG